jgi:hypothetical protein
MLIDFHVHTYADRIAKRAVTALAEVGKMETYTDGTVVGTTDKMREWGVDIAVNLPIATKPTQQVLLNDQAKALQDGDYGDLKWLSFGTICPTGAVWFGNESAGFNLKPAVLFDPDETQSAALAEMERIKSLGLQGIKLHPDYQGFFLFEERLYPIWKRAGELKLPVIIHLGHDPVSTYVRHSTPLDLAILADKFPDTTFIGAHLGGMFAWGDVAYHYKGKRNLYIDTAIVGKWCPKSLCELIISRLGYDRVLFGTDAPFSSVPIEKEFVESLNIPSAQKDAILYKNALELLRL